MTATVKELVCLNYINGEWTSSESGETINNFNPANGELVCKIQASSTNTYRALFQVS